MSLDFLLEIGAEEIPDWMIPPALNQLQDSFQTLLDQQGMGGMVQRVDATPRRLVLLATGLKAKQEDSEELVLGPPKSAGAGAAAGFAKKMGVQVENLGVQSTAKGEYLSFRKHTQGRATKEILSEALPVLILKLYFPKTMYWNGKGTERFIRPIRWIVALLGREIVPLEVARVHASNHTTGHRLLGAKSIVVNIEDFDEQLRKNFVILSAQERRAKIQSEIEGLHVKPDPGLLETLVYLTEYPTAIKGEFDEQFLTLPREILVTVMRHHQKYFSMQREDGSLSSGFVAVVNTDGDPKGLIKQGNERVLRARFNDARFFYDADQEKKLVDRLDDLAHVTFQAKIGNYLEKSKRMVELVKSEGGNAAAQRAALLSKTDLTTEMVKEFTDLQGIVGGLYAKAQGEPEQVWQAIYDHYKPLSMEDEIPRTLEGRWVAFADKWDTLVSCFNVGLIPSGSRDPFALRRAAQGLIKIIIEGKLKVTLRDERGSESGLGEFLRDRVDYYFREARGFKYDEVRACMGAGWLDLPDLEARLLRVQAVRSTPDFEPLAASFKRIQNILTQAAFSGGGAIEEALLEPGPERDLYQEMMQHQGEAIESRIASLRPKVDLFFDKVLVNAKEEAVRSNRLKLLHNLLTEFSAIADFSEIVTAKTDDRKTEE